MPKRSEYVQIPQSEDIDEDHEDEVDDVGLGTGGDAPLHMQASFISTTSTTASGSRLRSPKFRAVKIDLGTLDAAFKRWTNEITKKVRRKKKLEVMSQRKDIVFSVFQHMPAVPAPSDSDVVGARAERSGKNVKTLDDGPPMTRKDFDELTSSVKMAIIDGVHPKMITKGSSGSYFARKKLDAGRSQVVGVFKPKDEEPYGHLNPKTTKWIHRNLFWWVGFGRACLIPNLSYVSEAAASLLDERLGLQIVPRTELVSLSSPAFSYGWIDRKAYKKGKPLPEKVGSFQTFMHSYQDASAFLREHPWPGRAISDTYDERSHRTGGTIKRCSAALGVVCGRLGEVEEEDYHEDYDEYNQDSRNRAFSWTPALQQDFREELEKLIILDYLMRNTDRGLDNFMIRYCEGKHERQVVNRAPAPAPHLPMTKETSEFDVTNQASSSTQSSTTVPRMIPSQLPESSYLDKPHIHLAAIDNSLSFPHQHPKGWRSFVYGWLYLPVSLIGRPFSERTRRHFLPLLSDPAWWTETTFQLRKLHEVDPDFNVRMFQRQMAVMKGQGWNIVQSLKHADEGPLELTRRTKVMVWDEEIEVPINAPPAELLAIVSASQTKPTSISGDIVASLINHPPAQQPTSSGTISMPNSPPRKSDPPSKLPRDRRSRSVSMGIGTSGTNFPPRSHFRRSSTDLNVRPVPLLSKRREGGILGGATGVSVLEHLERLDEVESGLNRAIGRDGSVIEEDREEEDVAASAKGDITTPKPTLAVLNPGTSSGSLTRVTPEPNDVPTVDTAETDNPNHLRWASQGEQDRGGMSLDLPRELMPSQKTRIVIAERLETVDAKPFFSGW